MGVFERLQRLQAAKKSASRSVNAFGADKHGNIAMIFVLMSGVLFLFIGGALDYSHWNAVRTDMLESMDAATLALAQLKEDDETLTDTQLEAFGDQFFLENFKYEQRLKPGWDVDFQVLSDGNIRACMDGDIATYLLAVAKIHILSMDKCVEITPPGSGRIELALVLDVTGSMDWDDLGSPAEPRIDGLVDAVTELLDVLYDPGETMSDNIRIGVVPFNQYVNAGGASSWENSWGDVDALSYYHGYRYFHVNSLGDVDASTKVNHYRLYATDPNWSWAGCVESRPYPLDEMDTAPGATVTAAEINATLATPSIVDEPDATVRAAFSNTPSFPHGLTAGAIGHSNNSRWVPDYLGDGVDCNSAGECEHSSPDSTAHWTDYDYGDQSGTTSGGLYWEGDWFTDPDTDPVLTWVTESAYQSFNDYNQRFVIGDRLITNYAFGGAEMEKYLKVVRHFRDVMDGTTTDADFSAWLAANRVTHKDQEYIVRTGYAGVWDPATETYKGKFDQTTGQGEPEYDHCPPPITPLTNDRTVIEAARDALDPDGGTNISNGAVWGWRVVSDKAPFTESIGPGDTGPNNTTEGDWQRAVLIMTDGEMDFDDTNTHWGSDPSSYGYEWEQRMGEGVDQADSGGSVRHMEDEAYNKLLRTCHRMKEEGILVYTIVFAVSAGSTVEDVMKSCATDEDSPFFFNAESGADLEEAFGDIAEDLVKLHVSR